MSSEELKTTEQLTFEYRQDQLMKLLSVLQESNEQEKYLLLKMACEFFGIRLSWD